MYAQSLLTDQGSSMDTPLLCNLSLSLFPSPLSPREANRDPVPPSKDGRSGLPLSLSLSLSPPSRYPRGNQDPAMVYAGSCVAEYHDHGRNNATHCHHLQEQSPSGTGSAQWQSLSGTVAGLCKANLTTDSFALLIHIYNVSVWHRSKGKAR